MKLVSEIRTLHHILGGALNPVSNVQQAVMWVVCCFLHWLLIRHFEEIMILISIPIKMLGLSSQLVVWVATRSSVFRMFKQMIAHLLLLLFR